jgi:hypothetical protein
MQLQIKNKQTKNSSDKVCITYTCLSDNSQIIQNILWHQSLGANLFVLFLDGDLDRFKRDHADIKNLVVLESATYIATDSDPPWVGEAFNRKNESYDFEKVLNVYHACNIAHSEYGCDWVISIDADEIIYLPKESEQKNINSSFTFPEFFNSIDKDVLQIKFEAAELIPISDQEQVGGFSGLYYFATFPNKLVIFFGRIINRLMLALKINGLTIEAIVSLYYFLCGYNVRNSWSFFLNGASFKPYFLAYMGYKSAIRMPYHNDNIFSIHYWLNHWPKSTPKTIIEKYCLHFDLPSFVEFRKKSLYQVANPPRYQNRRKIFENGRNSDLEASLDFYHSEISMPIDKIMKLKRIKSILI